MLTLGMVLGGNPASSQRGYSADKLHDHAPARFAISIGTVIMPVGAFSLIRKDGQVGTIRLTSIDPAATKYLGKSAYEAYFQPDQAGSLLAKDVDHRTGKLNSQPAKGAHAVWVRQETDNKAR